MESRGFAEELAEFNEYRRALLNGRPPNPSEERMPLERSGVGGDVDEGMAE